MGGRGLRAVAVAALALAALPGCTALTRNHGYAPTDAELAVLSLGVDTRDSVIASVGRPTTGGVLDGSAFYYVQSRFVTRGFLPPEEVERQVLALSFAPDGTLGGIERFGLENGRVVALSRRTTDEIFADPGLIGQLFGNVGSISPGGLLGEE